MVPGATSSAEAASTRVGRRRAGSQLRGELVELADLPVEHGGGHVATRLADATRECSGRVAQLRPLVGGRGYDRAAHERRLVAGLNRDRELLVEELAASRVERKGLIGCGEVCVERRLREAGLDQQHSDSVLADLVVERFGVALEGVLAR